MHLPPLVSQITPAMIQELIENEVSESLWLEYKSALPGSTHDEKNSFLNDVIALANTAGGHIIYGIDEKDSVPSGNITLSNIVPEQVSLRLNSMLKDTIEPRIPILDMGYVDMSNGVGVFIIAVGRSWIQPHGVRVGPGTYRYYRRHSSGTYALSVDEIRTLFGQAGALLERARRFRLERVADIVVGEGTKPLRIIGNGDDKFKAVMVHIVPLALFDNYSFMDAYQAQLNPDVQNLLRPLTGSSMLGFSFDGLYTSNGENEEGRVNSYLQLFRNATVEMADVTLLNNVTRRDPRLLYQIATPATEHLLLRRITGILNFYQLWKVPAPIAIFLTIFGAEGYGFEGSHAYTEDYKWIRQSRMFFNEVIIQDSQQLPKLGVFLKPLFDHLWNAVGYERCPYYVEQGGEVTLSPSFFN